MIHFAVDLFRHTLDRLRPVSDTGYSVHRADAHGTRRPWHILPRTSDVLATSAGVEKVLVVLDQALYRVRLSHT